MELTTTVRNIGLTLKITDACVLQTSIPLHLS
jgi:hypothetical protein